MSEGREYNRAPIELKVEYKRLNSFFSDYTRNISKGGTFIGTKRALPVGTRFLFRLVVPGQNDPFELHGEVVHAADAGEAPGMGIRFIWSEDEQRRQFETLVERIMARNLGPMVTRNLLKRK
jgi:type IV pilus assembly protein PilZ